MRVPGGIVDVDITLRVDGSEHRLAVDTRTTLLDALRERLGITSPKKGCDHGQCGACTVLLDGRRALSCLALAVAHEGAEIVTAAGLAAPDGLHPMQHSFVTHDALQCGYCTPGQVVSAVGMLREAEAGWPSVVTAEDGVAEGVVEDDGTVTDRVILDAEEIAERMSGNLCRCGAYANIVPAIAAVAAETTTLEVAR
jgi:xanthine dehydrogenase YagT iron-sulfur-binding subunit